MKKKSVFIMVGLMISSAICGENIIKEAKAAIKAKSNLEAVAGKLIAEADSASSLSDRLDCYYYAALVNRAINDQENEKLYLKQAYDTARFFNSICSMFEHMYVYDSLAQGQPRLSSKKKRKMKEKVTDLLDPYHSNLLSGGRFFFKKKDYNSAFRLFDAYIQNYTKVGRPADTQLEDSLIYKVARWATLCGARTQNPQMVLKYADMAVEDQTVRRYIYEYKAKAHLALGDTAQWLSSLKNGLMKDPDYSYFYASLTDYLNNNKRYEEALALADTMISFRPKNAFYWYAKSLVLLNLKRYEPCIQAADSAIAYDSLYMHAYYNKGLAFCNLAVQMGDSASLYINKPEYQELHDKSLLYYAQALRPMEIVRVLVPDDINRWGPPLYRIYLNLNMGTQFAEMEKILKLEHKK